jgi:hypothetical protein
MSQAKNVTQSLKIQSSSGTNLSRLWYKLSSVRNIAIFLKSCRQILEFFFKQLTNFLCIPLSTPLVGLLSIIVLRFIVLTYFREVRSFLVISMKILSLETRYRIVWLPTFLHTQTKFYQTKQNLFAERSNVLKLFS